MNSSMNTIIHWLEHLNVLMPARNVALVGAGNGKGVWVQWLVHQASNSKVTFFEADVSQYAILQLTLDCLEECARHCEVRNVLIAAQQGTASFFIANSRQESGLLDPRSLLSLWPNLKMEDAREMSTITLDSWINEFSKGTQEVDIQVDEGSWLFIDCFPAAVLLKSANRLDTVDVVVARVAMDEENSHEGTSLKETTDILQNHGMLRVSIDLTKHPAIGYALFVRDKSALLKKANKDYRDIYQKFCQFGKNYSSLKEESIRKNEELQLQSKFLKEEADNYKIKLQEISKLYDEKLQLALETKKQIEELTLLKIESEKLANELALQVEKLDKVCAENLKIVEEKQEEIKQLLQDKLKAESLANERARQLKQLEENSNERLELDEEKIKQLLQDKLNTESLADERARQLKQLEASYNEKIMLIEEIQGRIRQLDQDKLTAESLSDDRARQLEYLNKSYLEKAKLAEEGTVKIAQLIQAAEDAEARFKEKYEMKAQESERDKSDAKLELDEAYKKEIDQLSKAYTKQKKISELQSIQLDYIRSGFDYSIGVIDPAVGKKSDTIVIDCGGHDGCSAIKLRLAYPDAEILTFEPNPDFWKYYELIPVRLLGKAVATHNGVIDITIDPVDGDGSSYVKTKKIDVNNKIDNVDCPIITVECIDLSQFLKNVHIHFEEIILKLDVEGAEYEILEKMIEDGSLNYVKKLYCEFHWEKIGMSFEEHNKIFSAASNITSIEKWDALEFSVHDQRSSRLHKIRSTILSSFKSN